MKQPKPIGHRELYGHMEPVWCEAVLECSGCGSDIRGDGLTPGEARQNLVHEALNGKGGRWWITDRGPACPSCGDKLLRSSGGAGVTGGES